VTPTIAVAAFVFDGDGRVLLIQRGRPPGAGLWTVPGGRLEPGETIVAGIAREVVEETGLAVDVGPLAAVVERITGGYHYVILDHVARPTGGTLRAATDAADARWVTDAELASLPTTEGLIDVLARARAIYAAW